MTINSRRTHSTLAWPCTHELARIELYAAWCMQVDEAWRKMSEFEQLVVELKALHQSGPCVTILGVFACVRARVFRVRA